MQNRILLVEDDASLNRGISVILKKEGYEVYTAASIAEAKKLFEENDFALVISDITLPDGNGLDFGSMVRNNSATYLIYLTVLDKEMDIVNGYDTGADDYITKPFSIQVLVSKVNAIMRRVQAKEVGRMESDGITFFLKEMKVMKDKKEVLLSKTELQFLQYLMDNAGQIVTKESILEHIWGVDGQFVDENTVNVNISRLKKKLATNAISTVRGLGFIWTANVIRH